MGYNTTYMLHTIPALSGSVINDLNLDEGYCELDDDEILSVPTNLFEEETKWYDHDKEMRAASLLHPDVVFILDGEGDDSGDIWRKFYRNGVVAKWVASIEPPAFSEHTFKLLKMS